MTKGYIYFGLQIFAVLFFGATICSGQNILYNAPAETAPHEGTWLQWPHNNLYGPWYQDDVEPTWIAMTNALQSGEKVHIVAYDADELAHIQEVLSNADVPLTNVDFFIFPTDDVWVRDNGPMFVYDTNNNLTVLDWGFNGWGHDTPYTLCDAVPPLVGNALNLPIVDLSAMVLEGGAIVHDGDGTMMATRSSIVHASRNPLLSEIEIEDYLTTYMGIEHFIWLDGVYGLEITDMHIDGFAKFVDSSTMVTMEENDLAYWEVPQNDINTLYSATNQSGVPYTYVYLPLTENDVVTTFGWNLGYKGSYVNYYVGNSVVVVPTYNDPNDAVAIDILQGVYPNRTVVGIDVRNIYEYGGMIHCFTQQQPIDLTTSLMEQNAEEYALFQNSPNPFNGTTKIRYESPSGAAAWLDVYDATGRHIFTVTPLAGEQCFVLSAADFDSGLYTYVLVVDGRAVSSRLMVVTK